MPIPSVGKDIAQPFPVFFTPGNQIIAKQGTRPIKQVKLPFSHRQIVKRIFLPARQRRNTGKDALRLQAGPVNAKQLIVLCHWPQVFLPIHEEIFQASTHSPLRQQTIGTLQHPFVRDIHRHELVPVFHPYISPIVYILMMIARISGKCADVSRFVMQISESRAVIQIELSRRGNQHTSVGQLSDITHLIARQTLRGINGCKNHKRHFGPSISCRPCHIHIYNKEQTLHLIFPIFSG